jgi:DNA-binding transcriptional ArsR family regulator
LPSQKEIAEKIFGVSRNTLVNHLKYLKDQGFIIDGGDYYILPNKEDIFFPIPLDLVTFFIDTLKEPVVKTYIYLGQRFNYKPREYVFTEKEIAEHIGMDYNNNSKRIAHYLLVLKELKLIDFVCYYEGSIPKKKLIAFSKQLPQITNG